MSQILCSHGAVEIFLFPQTTLKVKWYFFRLWWIWWWRQPLHILHIKKESSPSPFPAYLLLCNVRTWKAKLNDTWSWEVKKELKVKRSDDALWNVIHQLSRWCHLNTWLKLVGDGRAESFKDSQEKSLARSASNVWPISRVIKFRLCFWDSFSVKCALQFAVSAYCATELGVEFLIGICFARTRIWHYWNCYSMSIRNAGSMVLNSILFALSQPFHYSNIFIMAFPTLPRSYRASR